MYKYDIFFTYIYITIIIINYAITMQTFQTRDRLHKQKQNTVCIRVFQMENFVNVPLGNRLRNHTHTHTSRWHIKVIQQQLQPIGYPLSSHSFQIKRSLHKHTYFLSLFTGKQASANGQGRP